MNECGLELGVIASEMARVNPESATGVLAYGDFKLNLLPSNAALGTRM